MKKRLLWIPIGIIHSPFTELKDVLIQTKGTMNVINGIPHNPNESHI